MESLPVHPTQLYEAALGLVIIGVTLWIARRPWAREGSGRVFLAFAATYSLGRIAIETLRGDLGRGIYFGLSSGQIFSLCVLVAIAAGLMFARRRAMIAVGAVASMLVILVGDLHPAHAQQPVQPPIYSAPAVTAPAPAAEEGPTSHLRVGALLGYASPMNRRADQVPAFAGGTLSVSWAGRNVGVGLDFDSFGNTDASHGTVLLVGSFGGAINPKLTVGGRFGVGATLVNFDDPAFQDVGGTTVRFEGTIEYALGRSWMLWLRPLSIDILTAADLGGPITTYQLRLGAAYRFGLGGTRRSRPQPQPYQPYPQQPPGYGPGYPAQVPPGQPQPFYTPAGQPYYPAPPQPQPLPPPVVAPPPAPEPEPAPPPPAPKKPAKAKVSQ